MQSITFHPVSESRIYRVVLESNQIVVGAILGGTVDRLASWRLVNADTAGGIVGIVVHHRVGMLGDEILIDHHLRCLLRRINNRYGLLLRCIAVAISVVGVTTYVDWKGVWNGHRVVKAVEIASVAAARHRGSQTSREARIRDGKLIRPRRGIARGRKRDPAGPADALG